MCNMLCHRKLARSVHGDREQHPNRHDSIAGTQGLRKAGRLLPESPE